MNKFLSFIVCMFLAVTLQAQTATAPTSGEGSSGNPYQIATVNNLYWLSQNGTYWGKYYIQTANIDASGISNFTPIGNSTTAFTGTYNGYGYTISGLTESRTTDNSGLFGCVNGAAICNVGVLNASVSCFSFSGILIGHVVGGSTITQCFATGTISSTGGAVGGLIGQIDKASTLNNCYSICTVSSTVSGNFGGLVGYNQDGITVITNCYSSSTVSASGNIGGLVGNSGSVSSNSYYNSNLCSTGSAYATPKTAAELKTQSTFSGWDFTTVWSISSSVNGGFPSLLSAVPAGDGSGSNPYQIATLNNLLWFMLYHNAWGSYLIQTADINASATAAWDSGSGFLPIGDFYGNYNGQEHAISGLTINRTATNRVGLFGFSSGVIKNMRMVGSSISGFQDVGGIVGWNEGTINFCSNTGSVSGLYIKVGGIVGNNYSGGSITNSYNAGTVNSSRTDAYYVGGIAGSNYATITNCYNIGAVSNYYGFELGGVVGFSSGTLTNCYNAGTTTPKVIGTSDANIGGVVGKSTTTISHCYWNSDLYSIGNGNSNGLNLGDITNYGTAYMQSANFVTLLNANRGSNNPWMATSGYPTLGVNITYMVNGGTNNSSNPLGYIYGVGTTLNNPTRTGYMFNGWYDNAGFSGSAITAISTTAFSDVTLYAKWTANTYNITYTLNGGTNDAANTATYTYGVGLTVSNPTRTGYTFGGWYDNASFSGTAVTDISTTATGSVNLYAKWTVNTYNITYTLNDGANNASNTATYTYGVGLTLSNPTQTYYTFGGWYDNASFTGTAVTAISTTTTGNLTLYAKWTANTYNITYSLNGGTNDAANTATYTYGVGLTVSNPARTGYTFGGWYDNANFTGTAVTAISATATGDITLYAKWIAGDGTGSNPFQITTLNDLKWFSENPGIWNQDFIQTADIDASETSTWNSGSGFSPIGNSTTKFTGQYNGNGHTITNLTISRSTTDYIGLFGYIGSGAVVTSLGVTATAITGQNNVGVLAGYNSGTISSCNTGGTVTGGTSVGGFAGQNSAGTISKSYSTAATTGNNDLAAFVGDNVSNGNISNCYATGNSNGGTSSSNYTSGGLVGYNPSGSTITNCYATGNATGYSHVGGLVGSSGGTISNCFYNKDIFTGSTSYGMGKTTAELKMASTFINSGWDFTKTGTIWAINGNDNSGYPYLRYQAYPSSDIWLGTSTTEWGTAANWSEESVPAETTNVIVPNVTNDPVMSPTTTADCNNLTVEPAGNLTIQSSVAGTGSLIIHGTSSGTVTAERYLSGNAWHVVAPIAAGESISTFVQDAGNKIPVKTASYGMMDYNETGNSWNNYYTAATTENLTSGKGYSLRRTEDGVVTFTGTLTSSTKTVDLTKKNADFGWNCIGNPYSSAIGMNATATTAENFLAKNTSILDASYAYIYVWDDASTCYRILGNVSFGTRDLGGNYLQSGQGFLVKAKSDATSISFTTAMQSHQTATTVKSAQISWPAIRLNMANGTNTASTIIAFNNQMTNGLDVTYDAGLLRGTSGLEIYSRLVTDNGVDFAIQCLPENYNSLVIPIGVESKTGGEITFSAETVQLPADCSVILEDRTSKTFTSLAGGASYKTTVSAGTTAVGRFYIHTSNITTGTTAELPTSAFNLKAYPADELIWIVGEVSSAAKASLFDVSGRTLGTYRLQEGERNSIPASGLKPGVYLLKVTDGNKRFNTKMVIF